MRESYNLFFYNHCIPRPVRFDNVFTRQSVTSPETERLIQAAAMCKHRYAIKIRDALSKALGSANAAALAGTGGDPVEVNRIDLK